MVIYIDVLFLINLYVTYFELLSVSIFTHKNMSRGRMIISALIGGLFSFVIFLPDDSVFFSTIIKIFSCIIISLTSMGYKDFFSFFKNTVFLLLVNFIFAGLMLCLWLFVAPLDMFYSNGALYFDIDGLTIIISTSVAYFIVKGVRFLLDRNGKNDRKYSIEIHNRDRTTTLSALADTANGLVDYFSGLPVIICKKESCKEILPKDLVCILSDHNNTDIRTVKGVRLLPFSTIAGDSFVYSFKVDRIIIKEAEVNRSYNVKALIGVIGNSQQEYDAIFNPKILV